MQAQGRQPGVGRTTSLSACKRSRAVKPAIASTWDEAHLSVLNVRASSSPRFVRKLKKSATHETFNRDPTRFWNSSTSRCQQTCLRNRNAAGRENIAMIALVAQVPRTYLRPQSRHRPVSRSVKLRRASFLLLGKLGGGEAALCLLRFSLRLGAMVFGLIRQSFQLLNGTYAFPLPAIPLSKVALSPSLYPALPHDRACVLRAKPS